MSKKIKLVIEYKGAGYCGWQRQEDDPSIQQAIEEAIFALTNEEVKLTASGRTDAGVHALGQVADFDLEKEFAIEKIRSGLNHHLIDSGISILSAEQVNDDFSARFSAKKRYYKYIILNRRAPAALENGYVWHIPMKLDIDAMKEAAKLFVGKHDFSSFRASICQANSPVKTIDSSKIIVEEEHIYYHISAKSFLHHMVRNVIGTIVEVGKGKYPASEIPDIIAAKDRSSAGQTAPAHGLYFVKVDY
jgi:tRNA pseudouridine38-40 synthase